MPERPFNNELGPGTHPRRYDSDQQFHRGLHTDHWVKCVDCQKEWRFGCLDCAEHHVQWHQGEAGCRNVAVTSSSMSLRNEWVNQPPRRKRKRRTEGTQQLFGRFPI